MGSAAERASILVVDDERGPRESLRMILEPTHRVVQASSGAEALEILQSEPIDLVTLDLHMPGIRGDDLMRTIRREYPHVEVIVITGCGTIDSAAEGVRYGICDYLQKPFDVVQVSASASRALARCGARARLTSFLEELGDVVGRDREATAILEDLQRTQKLRPRLGEVFDGRASQASASSSETADPTRTLEFLEVLAETMETKDRFMRGHARRVAFYSSLLADRMNLSIQEREHVRIAAFLHDLGKVGVPTDLLLRAGALDPAERNLVEQHPIIGARLIAPLDIPAGVSLAIRHHHEWWDGTGYPDGVAGDDIPQVARNIAVADAFDAMSCDRPYRRALSRDLVVGEFERYAGTQFDPSLAQAFLALLEAGACELDADRLAAAGSRAAGDVAAPAAAGMAV